MSHIWASRQLKVLQLGAGRPDPWLEKYNVQGSSACCCSVILFNIFEVSKHEVCHRYADLEGLFHTFVCLSVCWNFLPSHLIFATLKNLWDYQKFQRKSPNKNMGQKLRTAVRNKKAEESENLKTVWKTGECRENIGQLAYARLKLRRIDDCSTPHKSGVLLTRECDGCVAVVLLFSFPLDSS